MTKTPALRAIRAKKFLTQRELAEKAGVTTTTVSRLETGSDGAFSTIRKLAAALDVEPQELVRE